MKLDEIKRPQPGDRCLICGAAPKIIGCFMPDNSAAWGAKNGKTRLIRYCLCESCQTKPDTTHRVEKIIRAELAGGVTHA